MNNRMLICTDLDRTLVPNGSAPEFPGADKLFARMVANADIDLAYVSGRHLELVEEAIVTYNLPRPDYIIGDVGTTLYHYEHEAWQLNQPWQQKLAPAWRGKDSHSLALLLQDYSMLALQEPEKQNRFKLSYYTPVDIDREQIQAEINTVFEKHNIDASLTWSIDDVRQTGLLDILPAGASKLTAIEFLVESRGYTCENTLFAGDSGNDIPVLTSHLQAVLVANATPDVRAEAARKAGELGFEEQLYLASGAGTEMNGNYAAGIIEGACHYIPAIRDWLSEDRENN